MAYPFVRTKALEYMLGFDRSDRLTSMVEDELEEAKRLRDESGKPARVFKELRYRTRSSCAGAAGWSPRLTR